MNYDVVLNANDNATLETQYAFTQGDYGQIQFSIRVKADGQYIADATRAYIVFTLSNGMIVTGADMPKNVATYTYVFQGNELQSPGKVVADVKLVYAIGQISSNKFTFLCRFDPLADKTVPAAPYITVLQRIVDEGQEKIDYLQSLIDSIQGSIGETALTRNDLQNTRDPVGAGLKALDAQMAQYLLLKSDLVNNGLTTAAGFALDARYGKTLKDLYDGLNSNLAAMKIPVLLGKITAVGSISINASLYREIALYIKTSAGGFLPPVIIHTNLLSASPLRVHPTMFYGVSNYLSTTVDISLTAINYVSSSASESSFASLDAWGIK
jgi:hypothetical protein